MTIKPPTTTIDVLNIILWGDNLITASQLRAARALLALDQRALAHAAQLSLPTIQRMEGSDGVIRGTVDSLMKLVAALEARGVELINAGDASSAGGRGVRLREASVVHRTRVAARAHRQGGQIAVLLSSRRVRAR